jgi:hypothetical protein
MSATGTDRGFIASSAMPSGTSTRSPCGWPSSSLRSSSQAPSVSAAERRYRRAWGASQARAPGARCPRNARCSFGLKPQRGEMERLAARGWHKAVSPPLGLREAAPTQIPGGSRPRLYDSAPLRGLRNEYQRQRNWDDPLSGASPTFHRPHPSPLRTVSSTNARLIRRGNFAPRQRSRSASKICETRTNELDLME